MKNMDNLYDILQIDDKIRDIEIKKAYIKMLRKYPPEKCPEEFKKIREAYEILIDPVLKAEYNAFINHKDNINEYRKKGNNALDKKQYRRAILYYKKILLIEPKLTFAKNKLGLVFFYDKQYEEAIIQFRELIQLNPHNSIFYNNLAYVYKEQRKYDLAEELLLKSYNIDSTNEKTVLVLVDIYIALGDYEKGIKFINRCIEENESDTFKEIMYYLKLIRIYVNINNINMISQILDRVKNIIPDEEKVKEYVVWKLQKILEELLKDNDYELGYNICEKLLQIDSKSEKILNLYNKFNEILKVHDLLKELARDERIIECLKKPIIYYLHWNINNEKEFNKKKKKNIEEIRESIENNFINVLKSINILKTKYEVLYKYKEELYKDAYNMANENKLKNINEQKYSEEVCACNEEKDWPILYSTNLKEQKRRYKLKRRFRKILLGCAVISLVLVITILKFHLFKRR
ncbi:hypothetical protein ADU80_03580 [Clostridium botulinum]|uniref:J domain-containing protein n=5 Tax=Clostridium botulinum TaxID=1491 RepID=A0A9Q1ZFE0_CLOBO|nr:TPR domain protein [Clostridium botulinum BKT015925]KEI02284.1 hypothetical protein Z953_07470 [Clostridium botulinum D str. 16868]KLU75087.1 hypothetical protein CBC3_10490 [Clostridium botulinum V891]KOA75060.1 hypothetical protein ADU78_09195 [Clostridium botulinum]MCD3197013.1 tetratricopeptide repeat protein [Clostridium botulinum C/D]